MKTVPPLSLALICLAVVVLGALLAAWSLQAVSPKAPRLEAVEGEQVLEMAGGRVRFAERGDRTSREAIVFLHGFNGQLGHWSAVWSRLDADCGRALRLDLPGFGGSSWETDDFALAAQAGRLAQFLDARGIDRVTLVGTSMGGSLAAWFAAHEPKRVKQLLLAAPSGWPDSLHYDGLFGLLVKPGPINRAGGWIARSSAYRSLLPDSRALQATSVTASYGQAWADALARIEAPTLLLWSRGDSSFHAAANTTAAIPGALLQPLAADAGHLLPATRPDAIAAATCALARGATPAQARAALAPLLAARNDR